MKEIRKWKLEPSVTVISMPIKAEILCVQSQFDAPCIWAVVDTNKPYEDRIFKVHGTGWKVPEDPGEYIGTFQLEGGALVFHVFERT